MALQGARMVVVVWMDQETVRWPPRAVQEVLGAYGLVGCGDVMGLDGLRGWDGM